MAALTENISDTSPNTLWLSTPITKVEKNADGTVTVYGKCTGDDLDLDDQIIDKDFARKALQSWFSKYANVRQMHSTSLPPGGKGLKLEEKEDGFYLTSKVVEPGAVKLVNEGVYSAYSIGISRPVIVRDTIAKNGRVTGGIVSEVSLVDFPANPTTGFKIADGSGDVQKVFTIGKAETSEPEAEGTEPTETVEKAATPDEPVAYCGDETCEVCPAEKKKLSTEERHDLPDSDFVFPEERKYPIPDECLIGETLIETVDEGLVPIRDLVGRRVQVLAYDVEQEEVVFAEAYDVRRTLEQAPLVRVTLDTGAQILCTPNHLFLLRDGTYRQAGDLVPGTSLMPSDISYSLETDGLRENQGVAGETRSRVAASTSGRRGSEVASSASGKGARVQKTLPGAPPARDARKGQVGTACLSTDAGVSGSAATAPAALQGEAGITTRDGSGPTTTNYLRIVRGGRPKDRVGPLPRNRSVPWVDLRSLQQSAGLSKGLTSIAAEDGSVLGELATQNHRVVSVEAAGFADTYDMTVDEYHNFSLGAGIFVHNSHARNALARVAQHGTEEEKKKVRAAVHRKFPNIKESDKSEEAEVTKTETPETPETEATSGTQALLEEATRLAKAGKMDEAIKALQLATDANLAGEAEAPAVEEATPVADAPADPAAPAVLSETVAEPVAEEPAPEPEAEKVKKALSEYSLGSQYKLRQLHDALCPVYDWDQVAAAHPSLAKNGVAAALGPSAAHLLYQMLAHEVSEDKGLGTEASDIKHIACAYFDLLDFLSAEAAEQATPVVLASIRSDLHKAFQEYYPNVHLSPLTFDSTDADHFRRNYIRDGRSPAFGSSTHAKLPAGHGEVDADDFQRAPLSAGHQRPAPGGEGNGVSITKAYEDENAEAIRSTMSAVHDHLAAQFPELCCSGPATGFELQKSLDERYQRQGETYDQRVLGVNPTVPSPAKLDTSGNLHEGAGGVKANSEWPNTHGIESSPVVPDGLNGATTTPPPSVKADEPEMNKLASPDETKAMLTEIRKQVEDSFTDLTSQISTLVKRIEDIETQADPAQAPWRGAVAAFDRVIKAQTAQSLSDEALSEVEKMAFDDRKEKVEYLVRQSNSHNTQIREAARAELRKLLG